MNPANKIVWIDVETSGVDHDNDCLLEIGAILTDMNGVELGPEAVYTSLINVDNVSKVMSESSPVVQQMHEKSGLWEDLWRNKSKPAHQVESEMIELLNSHVDDNDVLYFGGNSVTLDRNFVKTAMPALYYRLSYRSVDVSTLSIFLKTHGFIEGYYKRSTHRALSDIYESLSEYRHYRNVLCGVPEVV